MKRHSICRALAGLTAGSLLLAAGPLLAAEQTISLGDAVLTTLAASPLVQIEKEKVVQSRGSLQTATGQFDWVAFVGASQEREKLPISDRDRRSQKASQDVKNAQLDYNAAVAAATGLPYTSPGRDTTPIPEETEATTTTYSLGVSRQLRNGIQITPSVSSIDYGNNTSQVEEISRSSLDMEIVIPLIRGLGQTNTGAEEIAARLNLAATEHSARQAIAERIYATAAAYWNCLAALGTSQMLDDTEQRARQIYDLVERLVRGGETEPAVMHQARAQLAQRQRDRTSSRLRLYEARQALALAMGLTAKQMAEAPVPDSPFPAVNQGNRFEPGTHEAWLAQAVTGRGDFLAAKTAVEAHGALLKKARNDTKPRLDLTVKGGYAGMDESDKAGRYLGSLSNDLTGANAYAQLRLELPIFNDGAKGEVVRRNAAMREADLSVVQLSNKIASEILVAMQRVENAVETYHSATGSSEAYRKAADHENFKVRQGEASLSSLIDIEDKYYAARINQIDALRAYAVALAELRLVTGTLLAGDQAEAHFRVDSLLSLPPVQMSSADPGAPPKKHTTTEEERVRVWENR